MSDKQCSIEMKPVLEIPKRSKKSWKSVSKAVKYYEEGRYGKALPRLFKYEDVEPTAMFCLACMYNHGQGVIKNMKTAVSYLLKLVDYENIKPEEENLLALTHYYLGDLYYRGVVFFTDTSKAEDFVSVIWETASGNASFETLEEAYPDVTSKFLSIYRHWKKGACMKKNKSTDRFQFGTVKCQTALGMFYSSPKFNKSKKALYWHRKAAKSGSILSEGALGVMYMYGIGTEEDLQLAYNHLTNAAVMENLYAKGYLTAYYYKRQIYHRAVSLGRELAELEDYKLLAKQNDCNIDIVKQGIAVGCFYLAMCLQYGYATEKNIPLAKSLIKKALMISTDVIYDLHIQAILGTV